MVLTCNFQQGLYIPTTTITSKKQKQNKKKNPVGLVGKNKKFSRTSHLFVHFFAVLHDYDVKMPTFTWRYKEDVNKRRWNFISLSELGYDL